VIRVLVIGESHPVRANLTRALCRIEDVDIVAHARGRNSVFTLVDTLRPDVVFVDELLWSGHSVARVREALAAYPPTVVIGLVERPDAGWIVEGLRAGATAVVPRDLEPTTLALVLDEALAHDSRVNERHAA
jgi:DNA-binding NarL/FixJ family response regulator